MLNPLLHLQKVKCVTCLSILKYNLYTHKHADICIYHWRLKSFIHRCRNSYRSCLLKSPWAFNIWHEAELNTDLQRVKHLCIISLSNFDIKKVSKGWACTPDNDYKPFKRRCFQINPLRHATILLSSSSTLKSVRHNIFVSLLLVRNPYGINVVDVT